MTFQNFQDFINNTPVEILIAAGFFIGGAIGWWDATRMHRKIFGRPTPKR